MHVVSMISKYLDCAIEMHLLAAKRFFFDTCNVLKSLGCSTKKEKNPTNLFGFTDSDYAKDLDDRKGTSGYVFMLGTTTVSWSSKKQSIVILSSTKVEFVIETSCACQAG